MFGKYPGLGVLYIVLFNALFLLLVVSYVRVSFTDPGSPPVVDSSLLLPSERRNSETDLIKKDVAISIDQVSMITAKRNGEQRRCRKCNSLKPDRTHHCSMCNKCILKFDHHCVWVNNCVGFRNQKFFLLFLIYCSALGLYVFTSLVLFYGVSSETLLDIHQGSTSIQVVFLAVVGLVFGLGLAGFSMMHIHFVLNNKTTLESFERNRYKDVVDLRNGYVNLFDLGKQENWREVMGADWRLWFIPVRTTRGNGLSFRYNQEAYETLLQRVEMT